MEDGGGQADEGGRRAEGKGRPYNITLVCLSVCMYVKNINFVNFFQIALSFLGPMTSDLCLNNIDFEII